jgi:hypothetical protein
MIAPVDGKEKTLALPFPFVIYFDKSYNSIITHNV